MPACAATNLPRVDDVLASLQVSSHKCKVMYYTEVIGSEDFRYGLPAPRAPAAPRVWAGGSARTVGLGGGWERPLGHLLWPVDDVICGPGQQGATVLGEPAL